ncbi:MAG: gluconolactonase [Planctomycetes bacterium]|nr:gluconolactonase [Planctomycetota bacterium]
MSVVVLLLAAGCASPPSGPGGEQMGKVVRLDPRLDDLIPVDAKIEKLAGGFAWCEGPVWLPEEGAVVFSDIPNNRVMRWKEGEGLGVHLRPSGYTGETSRGGETGSNALLLDPGGNLVLCQHGDRRISRLKKDWSFEPLVTHYGRKRLNSPNDATFHSSGDLYFTDPPYGLELRMADPAKELLFQGVYRLPKGSTEPVLLTKDITRPNGIGLSPDEKKLYVACSDPDRAIWMVYDVQPDGSIANGKVFFDATPWFKEGRPGLPDGLKVDRAGNICSASITFPAADIYTSPLCPSG